MGTLDDVLALDATGQAELLRAGERESPPNWWVPSIDAAHERNDELNAIIHPRYDAALAEAAAGRPRTTAARSPVCRWS